MNTVNLDKARREDLRWRILQAVYEARPVGTSESVILRALLPVFPDITLLELRRELDYLAARKLIMVTEKETSMWFVKINRYGMDIVEYTVSCDPGIARPKEW